ncbi:hypothetical protein CEXT_532521 [Caerostris extrusa]|uniref:Uncharacterized protein n=1 Tax=Caerostris extrusa TaxID=172846 RepID=A0AAV4SY61_CAEEX|nr:hypothetical protein CEXT_532521 [Caerostris extrusa]
MTLYHLVVQVALARYHCKENRDATGSMTVFLSVAISARHWQIMFLVHTGTACTFCNRSADVVAINACQHIRLSMYVDVPLESGPPESGTFLFPAIFAIIDAPWTPVDGYPLGKNG